MIKKSCEEKRHEKKKKRILRKRNHLRNKMAENGSEKRSKYENIYIFFTNFRIKRSLVYLRKEEMDNNIRFMATPTVVVLFFMIQRKYLHRHYFCVSTICNKYKDARNNIFQRSVLILKNEYAALKKEYI